MRPSDAVNDTPPPVVEGRNCDGCTLCCKLPAVVGMAKPPMVWCKQADPGKGCRIYDNRPNDCRWFYCRYLLHAEIGEHWKPLTSRMVLDYEKTSNGERLAILVDAGRPDLWRKEPYFSDIKRWAEAGARNGTPVIVLQGLDAVVIFPDSEKKLGKVKPGQKISTSVKHGPLGLEFDAELVDAGDPRLHRLAQPPR